jgi:hypothetical protein
MKSMFYERHHLHPYTAAGGDLDIPSSSTKVVRNHYINNPP